MKSILRGLFALSLLFAAPALAATAYDTPYATPSAIVCASDALCAVINHIRVQAVTASGLPGSALYTWKTPCGSAPDAVFFIRPTGATTGCFTLEGFGPSAPSSLVTLTGSQVLTNKTISGASNTLSNIGNGSLTNSSITINGTSVSLGGTRTLTLASSDFANQGTATTVLHGNGAGNPSFSAVSLTADVSGILPGANGGTGNGFFAVSGPATSLKTFTFPNASDTVDVLGTAQTFTAVKTFTNSDISLLGSSTGFTTFTSDNAGASNFTLHVPAANDTIAAISASQTLTNKTISGASNTLSNIGNGSLTNSSTTVNGVTCTLGASCTPAGSLVVGTSAIASGTSGYAEYNNAGVVGEFPLTQSPILINGELLVDQRNVGASQTITTAGGAQYTVDRWYATATGANVTAQRVAGTSPYQYAEKITGAASNTGVSFGQRIESANSCPLISQTVAIQAQIASSTITTETWTAYFANSTDNFGAHTQIATGTWTITSTPTIYTATFNMGASACNGVEIVFSNGALLAAQTIQFAGLGLNVGAAPGTLQHVAFGQTLLLCQRYFEKSSPYGTVTADNSDAQEYTSAAYSTTHAISYIQYAVQKRVTPTVTLFRPSLTATAGQWGTFISAWTANSASTVVNNTANSFGVDATTGAAVVQAGAYPASGGWTSNAEL